MTYLYNRRVSFFNKIVKQFKHKKLHDLLVVHKIDKEIYKKLQKSAREYLAISKINNLVNMTPNGRLAPKKENQIAFNNFAQAYFQMIKSLKIQKYLKNYIIPVIRYKGGKIDQSNKKNNSRSELPHSDTWAGWTENCLLFFLPLAGDVLRNNVKFFKLPKNIKSSWFKRQSFADASKKFGNKFSQIKPHYKLGYIYIADISLPHVTIREKNAKSRLSVDSALQFKTIKTRSSHKYLTAYISSKENFIPISKADLINKEYYLKCNYKMGEFEIVKGKEFRPVYNLSKKYK